MNIRLWSAAVLAALLIPAGAAQADPLLDLIPADADSVVCVNLRKLADDPVTTRVLSSGPLDEVRRRLLQFQAITGIDPMKDLDRACYARNMEAGEKSSVLLVQGRYDENRLRGLLALSQKSIETTAVGGLEQVNTWMDDPDERKYQAFLPEGRMVLAFSREALEKVAVALREPGSAFQQRLGEELAELLPPDYPNAIAWLHIPTPGKSPFGSGAPATLHIRSFGAVADFQDNDLVVSATARLDSPARAGELKKLADGLIAFGQLQNDDRRLNSIAHRISLRAGESSRTLTATLQVPVDEIAALVSSRHRDGSWKPGSQPGTEDEAAEAELARRRAELAKKHAEMAAKQAEMAKEHARMARARARMAAEQARIERELRALEEAGHGTTATLPLPSSAAPPVPPVPPAPPVPPVPPSDSDVAE